MAPIYFYQEMEFKLYNLSSVEPQAEQQRCVSKAKMTTHLLFGVCAVVLRSSIELFDNIYCRTASLFHLTLKDAKAARLIGLEKVDFGSTLIKSTSTVAYLGC